MLEESKCISSNYRNKEIPSIGGIVFIPIILVSITFLIMNHTIQYQEYIRYLFIVCCMGIIGLLDDLIGEKSIKGIKNHIMSFFRGKLTTGFIKASTGGFIAIIISYMESANIVEAIINFCVIIFFTNTLNLFDLRPGRSTKILIVTALPLVLLNLSQIYRTVPLIIIVIAAMIYLYYDLNEKCMLGDVGSNIFGITLGYYSVQLLNNDIKLIIIILLAFLNILSEKKSLTEIISKSRILSFLDNIGRG
jgi:UDP-N-acetylmuramyl pentapeptide phosphotransferase/UDP-N-acetylglucosamine-1-phosphate transferase